MFVYVVADLPYHVKGTNPDLRIERNSKSTSSKLSHHETPVTGETTCMTAAVATSQSVSSYSPAARPLIMLVATTDHKAAACNFGHHPCVVDSRFIIHDRIFLDLADISIGLRRFLLYWSSSSANCSWWPRDKIFIPLFIWYVDEQLAYFQDNNQLGASMSSAPGLSCGTNFLKQAF